MHTSAVLICKNLSYNIWRTRIHPRILIGLAFLTLQAASIGYARFWGSILGSLRAGVNFPHLSCQTALNISFQRPRCKNGVFFVRGLSGRVAGQHDIPYSWRKSNLPYVLMDPMPEAMHRLRKVSRPAKGNLK